MTDRKRRTLGGAALALGLAVLCFMLILTALHGVGTDDGLYFELQRREREKSALDAPWGIDDENLRAVDAALADYLAGDEAALGEDGAPLSVVWDGAPRPAFGERELAHMADCFNLFALLRKVRSRLIPWAVLLIAGGVYLLEYDRRGIRKIAWLSPLILLVPLGAFGIWAALDFDGAFTFFHRLLFANDLWLLDPRTELLIRVCPQSMFAAMGLRIALWGLAALVGVPLLLTGLTFIMPKMDRDEGNKWNDNRTTRRAAAQRRKTFDFGERR